ncbi:hypothetical protein B0H11DRAFT_1714903 [Mycena galericulata]|nr:hypothetical protein B0H11DRAFT_1714903 [Mycena galericulata]
MADSSVPTVSFSVPAIPFPAVERDSGQKQGEDIHAFMERRRLHNEKRAQHESPQAKTRRLAQEAHASKGGAPGKKGARVFIWEEEEGGFFIRRAYNRTDAADRWDEFTPNQRIYDSFSNQWDLCTALAPNEDAEPDCLYDDDDDDFRFHQPTSPANIIPSIPDVPGREAMEAETGERAAELRFGFEEPTTAPSSSQQMQAKACAWAVGDETWPVPELSALPTLLHHILQGDLNGIPANLCDLTSPDSDLSLDWNVDVKIFGQRDKTFYEIRPRGAEASSPSILLESAATVLQIVRSGWGHDSDLGPIIRNLVELGAEFHPCWQRPAPHVPLAPPSQLTLGRRPAGYKPTLVDFGVYVQRRDAFLRSSRGRAALFYGGIVGRLARMVIPDFEDVACLDPSEDILKTGAHVSSGNGEGALCYEALTEDEIDLICGVYTVETGTFSCPFADVYAYFTPGQKSRAAEDGQQLKSISWWPKPTAFYSTGLNTGWWNSNCERWFVKRSKEIERTSVELYTYAQWKNKHRFSTAARKVGIKNDQLAAQYLAARF